MRRKPGKSEPQPDVEALDPQVLEQRRRERAAALDDLTEAQAQLRQAASRMAERERQLAKREEELEAQARRLARKLEARREGQNRLDAFRGRFGDRANTASEPKVPRAAASDLQAREAELDRFAADLEAARAQSAQAQTELQARTAEVSRREEELVAREAAMEGLEPRERAAGTREKELEAWERKLKREAQRQEQTAERLNRHSADLAERERALARLGQSLLDRRGGDVTPAAVDEVEIAFSEGFEALSAAAKTVRRDRA